MDIFVDVKIKTDAINTIEDIISGYSHFKIGKTGQNLSDRFDCKYKDEYDEIKLIYKSNNKKIIDEMESFLIEYFLSIKKYKLICNNQNIGGGEMDNSNTYYVYIVIKK